MGAIIRDPKYRWPNGIIPYTIDPALPDHDRVHRAIQHWEAMTVIRFIKKRYSDQNYIVFAEETDPQACCHTPLGLQGGGQQVLLATGCGVGQVIHEIGHAVGLSHEHQRNDRDRYVEVIIANVEPRFHHDLEPSPVGRSLDIGYYDYGSIMHYDESAFGIPDIHGRAKTTIRPKYPSDPVIPNEPIGQRKALSRGDMNTVFCAYECPNAYQPPRLQVGDRAILDPKTTANKVREKPGVGSAAKNRLIQPGQEVGILEGPRCAANDRFVWWRVQSEEAQVEGWTAEAGADGYWLVPVFEIS